MKKFMERFIEAVRKYEELLSYAQGGFILPYHSGAGMIGSVSYTHLTLPTKA